MEKIVYKVSTGKGNYCIKLKENGKKVFVKNIFAGIDTELNGYNAIKNIYKVPQMLYFDYKTNTIEYEYIDSLYKSTLHIGLFEDIDFDIDKIVDILVSNYKNYNLMPENLSTNSSFFIGRIPFIANYLKSKELSYDKSVVYRGENLGCFKDIVITIISQLTKNRIVPVALTQGDPTDLNVSIDGYITDFEMAGKNSIINEIAIFLGCYIVNCYYFFIKYMNSPHKLYVNTLNKYKNSLEFEYKENDDEILTDIHRLLPVNVKHLILKFLDEIQSLGVIDENFQLGPYVAMRMISPVNIDAIDQPKDKYLLFTLAGLFAKKYISINDIIDFIKEI